MKKTSCEVSEAGQKFVELYAEPMVTNSYLKTALLSVSLVCIGLLLMLYRMETTALHLKPLVISVSDIGRGQIMNYNDFSKIPLDRSVSIISPVGQSFTMVAITRRLNEISHTLSISSQTPCSPPSYTRPASKKYCKPSCSIPLRLRLTSKSMPSIWLTYASHPIVHR